MLRGNASLAVIVVLVVAGIVGGLFAVAYPLARPLPQANPGQETQHSQDPPPGYGYVLEEQFANPGPPPGYPPGPSPLGVQGQGDSGWDDDWIAPDTAFCVFNQEATNELQTGGSQPYGSMHKVGVDKVVIDAVPNRMADFIHIRDHHAAREAYLATEGLALTNPNGKWNVQICELVTVGDEQRYIVIAGYGEDPIVDPNASPFDPDDGTEQDMCELWILQAEGTPPVLLERSQNDWILLEGKTTAEIAAEDAG